MFYCPLIKIVLPTAMWVYQEATGSVLIQKLLKCVFTYKENKHLFAVEA